VYECVCSDVGGFHTHFFAFRQRVDFFIYICMTLLPKEMSKANKPKHRERQNELEKRLRRSENYVTDTKILGEGYGYFRFPLALAFLFMVIVGENCLF